MSRLLVFNPDHEYALADGKPYYSAPASISALAAHLRFLPLFWSCEDDFILLPDGRLASAADCSEVRFIEAILPKITRIDPWGWNPALSFRLTKLGIDDALLPSPEVLAQIKRLAHRRLTIDFNKGMNHSISPEEFSRLEDAMEFYHANPDCYFKMPWSGGGRGVLDTSELNALQTEQWLRGALRKQGSILAERRINSVLNFASLWDIKEKEVYFYGLSVSLSDGRGKYKGNLSASQADLESYVRHHTPGFSMSIIEAQTDLLCRLVAPYYEGKCGIDMMADADGVIHPCVELNLRRTMGHVAVDCANISLERNSFIRSHVSAPLYPLNNDTTIL